MPGTRALLVGHGDARRAIVSPVGQVDARRAGVEGAEPLLTTRTDTVMASPLARRAHRRDVPFVTATSCTVAPATGGAGWSRGTSASVGGLVISVVETRRGCLERRRLRRRVAHDGLGDAAADASGGPGRPPPTPAADQQRRHDHENDPRSASASGLSACLVPCEKAPPPLCPRRGGPQFPRALPQRTPGIVTERARVWLS